ncbi:MAG: hypothetical protein QW177_06240 [Candidatus Nitrosotenuis sp.]
MALIIYYIKKLKKPYLLLLMMFFSIPLIPNSNATHISKPIIIEPQTEYLLGEKITINGWVSYDDKPTPDVLLNFKVIKPDGTAGVDTSFPSDDDGYFQFEYDTKDQMPGIYQIIITSMCWEVHRQICTHQNQIISITVNNAEIPDWIRNNAKWWSEKRISDSDFIQGIQYLIKKQVIVVPHTEQKNTSSSQLIPDWIRNNAKWWSEKRISDSDFLNGIQYLIAQGLIRV